MQPATARSLFGSADGTPSAAERQAVTVSPGPAATSLVAYKEDCGSNLPTCPRQTSVTFTDGDDGTLHIVRIVCKTWPCPYCGPIKRANLAAKVRLAKPNRFVTLTAQPGLSETPRNVFDRTRRQISELAKLYRREGKEFEYIRVLEQHENGYPHYHLIVRSPWLDQKELSHRWCQFTQSYIVDVRKLSNNDKGINYVMKYLGKQTTNSFTDRRVSFTRNFFAPTPPEPKSERCVVNAQRWAGSLEDVTYWEFPGCSWEKINQWHWTARAK